MSWVVLFWTLLVASCVFTMATEQQPLNIAVQGGVSHRGVSAVSAAAPVLVAGKALAATVAGGVILRPVELQIDSGVKRAVRTACWDPQYSNANLNGYASTVQYTDLNSAQTSCSNLTACTGVVFSPNTRNFTLRSGAVRYPSTINEITWARCGATAPCYTTSNNGSLATSNTTYQTLQEAEGNCTSLQSACVGVVALAGTPLTYKVIAGVSLYLKCVYDTTTACWDPQYNNVSLFGFPIQTTFADLNSAKQECALLSTQCTGVVYDPAYKTYTPRNGTQRVPTTTGETTWAKCVATQASPSTAPTRTPTTTPTRTPTPNPAFESACYNTYPNTWISGVVANTPNTPFATLEDAISNCTAQQNLCKGVMEFSATSYYMRSGNKIMSATGGVTYIKCEYDTTPVTPTATPVNAPTAVPTSRPAAVPTNRPTASPTHSPVVTQTSPTNAPTRSPTRSPTPAVCYNTYPNTWISGVVSNTPNTPFAALPDALGNCTALQNLCKGVVEFSATTFYMRSGSKIMNSTGGATYIKCEYDTTAAE
jgi:hypothetical protein